jgi:hypothetical protein
VIWPAECDERTFLRTCAIAAVGRSVRN